MRLIAMKHHTIIISRRIATLVTLLFIYLSVFADAQTDNQPKSTFQKPDFAFPQTVEKDARAMLTKSMADGDGLNAMLAAMQITVARNEVSNNAFKANVALIDSITPYISAPYNNLCRLLQATMYRQYFNNNRYNYSSRVIDTENYPEDPAEWSRTLFAKKILQLVSSATTGSDAYIGMPLNAISPIVEIPEASLTNELSVFDFISLQSHELLNEFGSTTSSATIPFYPREQLTSTVSNISASIEENCHLMATEIIQRMETANRDKDKVLPYILALLTRCDNLSPQNTENLIRKALADIRNNGHNNADNSYNLAKGMLLHRLAQCVKNDSDNQKSLASVYADLKSWLAANPKSIYAPTIRYDIADISRKTVSINIPSSALPGTGINATAKMNNVASAYALIYKVPESSVPMNSVNPKSFPSKAQLVKKIRLSANGKVPFSDTVKFTIPALEAGYYVVIPSTKQTLDKNWKKRTESWSNNIIPVSDIAIISSSNRRNSESNCIYVVDAKTQQPVKGASITLLNDTGKKTIKTGATDARGMFVMPEGNYRICARKGGSVVWQYGDFHAYNPQERIRYQGNILTDLAVYRPGDKVQFVLTAWSSKVHDRKLLENEKISFTLRGANGEITDTVSAITDHNGRCNASFVLPDNGLLGSASITAKITGKPEYQIASTWFEVAEYKTPGFLVNLEKAQLPTIHSGKSDSITFNGLAATFSGMAVTGAQVSYNVTWDRWSWRWRGSDISHASYRGTTTTDGQGNFKITLPVGNLLNTPYADGVFTITADVTSPSGETQASSPIRFSIGNGATISPLIPDKILAKDGEIRFNVEVRDMLGLPLRREVKYTIENSSTHTIAAEGTFISPEMTIPAGKLPSAGYTLKFSLDSDSVSTSAATIIYRADDKRPPADAALWAPESRITAEDGEQIEVTAGSSYPGSYLLCEITDENKVLERRWIECNAENLRIPVEVTSATGPKWINLSGMHNLKQEVATIEIMPKSLTRKLDVKVENMREKLTAGVKEHWKFLFTEDGKPQANIPVYAVMSDKALNSITPFQWHFSIPTNGYSNCLSRSFFNVYNRTVTGRFSTMPRYPKSITFTPTWNEYGLSFAGRTNGMIRMKGMSRGVTADGIVEEVMSTISVTSAPLMMSMAKNEYGAADMVMEESAEAQDDGAMIAGGNGAGQKSEEIRPVEMPLAFFMPNVVTDSDGEANIEFVTPNFNTTWQFQIAGYNRDLLTASLMRDAMASKPVMVQSNLPRFVRTGDHAFIEAMVFNNSTETLPMTYMIEVRNTATGIVIAEQTVNDVMIAPSANAVISINFTVPSDVTSVEVISKASSGNFTDAEKGTVAILPSSAPVVSSTQFYAGARQTSLTVKLPKFRKNSTVTLTYCDNPVWECLKALPPISEPQSKSVLAVTRALYANITASHIAQSDTAIAKAIAKIASDTSLKSNLESNGQLKIRNISDTPWLTDAQTATETMRQLASLTDPLISSSAISNLTRQLNELQNTDGGWSWCPGMKSSRYITQSVLYYLALLKENGTLTSDLEAMAKKGISYCDYELTFQYSRDKSFFSPTEMLDYLYIRSYFPAKETTMFARMKREALSNTVTGWERFNLNQKATAAMLLSRTPSYERMAGVILESISQFATKSDTRGWSFENVTSRFNPYESLLTTAHILEAYKKTEPRSAAVDGLSQWLLLQKETESWKIPEAAVSVIQALMPDSAAKILSSTIPEILVNGKKVDTGIEAGDYYGNLTLDLNPSTVSGKKLQIIRNSSTPAWGGIIEQYVEEIAKVKKETCDNLSISKTISAEKKDAKEVEDASASMTKGDLIRINLTIKCEKDMEYVVVEDNRAACLEPVDQLSGMTFVDGLPAYRETRNASTLFFIEYLPKGTYVISYLCHADRSGEYSLGVASVQSLYSPSQTAHSAGNIIRIYRD